MSGVYPYLVTERGRTQLCGGLPTEEAKEGFLQGLWAGIYSEVMFNISVKVFFCFLFKILFIREQERERERARALAGGGTEGAADSWLTTEPAQSLISGTQDHDLN